MNARLRASDSAGRMAHLSPPPTSLRDHARAIRQYWRMAVALTLIGIAAAAIAVWQTAPVYATTTTYFVGASLGSTNNALQADEYAQRRINSYVGVVSSERMAKIVIEDTGLPLQPRDISDMITATVKPDTVLLTVIVRDTSSDRSMQIAQSIARNLDTAVGELDNRRSQSTVEISVLSGPALTPFAVSPNKKLYLAMGLLIGLGAGLAQAILRHQLDTTLRDRDELAKAAGVPTLGQTIFDKAAKAAPIITQSTGSTERAEVFRQLRTNLRFVDGAGPVAVLAVTSSIEREGKTTTAANLAVSFAQAGVRVVLVDADLRQSQLGNYLDLESAAGLTSVLIGDASLDDVVQEWGEDGLRVLTSGPIPANPSELLGSPAMEKITEELRSSYDLVIIDSPPLLPVADAALISAQADGVLLLVQHGKVRREQMMQALTQLESVDARILGTVLTMAPAPGGSARRLASGSAA